MGFWLVTPSSLAGAVERTRWELALEEADFAVAVGGPPRRRVLHLGWWVEPDFPAQLRRRVLQIFLRTSDSHVLDLLQFCVRERHLEHP